MVVGVTELLTHVLRNPDYYPGPHNNAQPRTSTSLETLDPARQLRLIFDAFVVRLEELLSQGQSVRVPEIGLFTFEITPSENRRQKWNKRPVYVAAPEILEVCSRFSGKEDIRINHESVTLSGSVPAPVTVLNESPIAQAAYYHTAVVKSGLTQCFKAVADLINRGYDLQLEMGAVRLSFFDKSLKCAFSSKLEIGKMEKTGTATWKNPPTSIPMSTFIQNPHDDKAEEARIATRNLDLMCRDLNTVKTA